MQHEQQQDGETVVTTSGAAILLDVPRKHCSTYLTRYTRKGVLTPVVIGNRKYFKQSELREVKQLIQHAKQAQKEMTTSSADYLSVSQAAKYLGVGRSTIYFHVNKPWPNHLPHIKKSHGTFIRKADLDALKKV